jgi:short-subunit dehydrogenase
MRFSGQTVLITGAATQTGRRLARAFAAEGAHLVLWDRDAAGVEALRAELETTDRRIWTSIVDLADGAAIDAAARRCLAVVGPVDVLVHASRAAPGGTTETPDDDALERTAHAFLPSMLKRHAGHIVAIASGASPDGALRVEHACAGTPVRTTIVSFRQAVSGKLRPAPDDAVRRIVTSVHRGDARLVLRASPG